MCDLRKPNNGHTYVINVNIKVVEEFSEAPHQPNFQRHDELWKGITGTPIVTKDGIKGALKSMKRRKSFWEILVA